MAKQKGLVKLEGTVGDMTYYKSKDGYLAKEKTSLNGDRIASDPKFKRTRENNAEFGAGGNAGKLMRHAVNALLKNAKDSKVVSRVTKTMIQIIKTDTVNKRGKRTVTNGDMSLLKNFEFNAAAVLGATLYAPYTTAIDRTAGTLSINLAAFIPSSAIIAPEGATHFKIVSAGAEIDFDNKNWVSANSESALFPWDETVTTAINLVNTVTPGTTLPVFLFLGIQFLQEVNGIQYPLLNGSFNPLSLIELAQS
jgi:hypothetical protein